MAAMLFKLPPQFGQCSMSMSKTRLSSLAQLRRAGALRVIACGRKAREVRTSTSYPTVHLRFDIHASSLLGEIKPPLIASRQAHPPMPSSLEAPSSNGEAPDQKRRGQRKTTQPAASNRLMGLLRRYTRVRIHPNRVLLRPAPMSSSHCFALAKRSCGMRLADTTGSG